MKTSDILVLAGMPEVHQKLQNVLRMNCLSYGEVEDHCLQISRQNIYHESCLRIDSSVKKEKNNIAISRTANISFYSPKLRKLNREGFWKIFPDSAYSYVFEDKFILIPSIGFGNMELCLASGNLAPEELIRFWSQKANFDDHFAGKNFNYIVPELGFYTQQQDVFQNMVKRDESRIISYLTLNFDIQPIDARIYVNPKKKRITLFDDITFALFQENNLMFAGNGSPQKMDTTIPRRDYTLIEEQQDQNEEGENNLPF